MTRLPDPDLACAIAGMAGLLAVVPGTPLPVRILTGVPLLLFLPGFAVVRACTAPGALPRGMLLLASCGAGLAVLVCTAVLLGAAGAVSGPAVAGALTAVTVTSSALARRRRLF